MSDTPKPDHAAALEWAKRRIDGAELVSGLSDNLDSAARCLLDLHAQLEQAKRIGELEELNGMLAEIKAGQDAVSVSREDEIATLKSALRRAPCEKQRPVSWDAPGVGTDEIVEYTEWVDCDQCPYCLARAETRKENCDHAK